MSKEDKLGDVLVVDDTPDNLELLMALLESNEFTVRPALNGELALASARNSPPDIILLDIIMPEMDGYEVCRQLKGDPNTRNIPIIFISALDEAIDKVKAFSVGGDDYITKPFHIEEVASRIVTHMEIQRLRQQDKLHVERLSQEIVERERAEKTHQQLARVRGLFRSTLDQLTEIAKQSPSADELCTYVETVQAKLDAMDK